MKSIIRVFLLIVIGLSVFLGALLISSGMQTHKAVMPPAETAQAEAGFQRDTLFDQAEGSAL